MVNLEICSPSEEEPDPSGPLSKQIPSTAIASTNVKVLEALKEHGEVKKKRPRRPYFLLTPS